MEPFNKLFLDDTKKAKKIKKSNYLIKGKYPIIDQSKNFISGYSNDKNKTYTGKLPVIIFGDHTRILKFIDFPFILGADGTKIIAGKTGISLKYLFYNLKSKKIINLGYSRHFKLIKSLEFHIHDKSIQKEIERKLNLANELKILYERSFKKTYELINLLFYQFFGNPFILNENEEFETLLNLTTKIGSGSTPRGGSKVYKDSGVLFLRSQNVLRNQLNLYKPVFITNEVNNKMKGTQVEYNDILLNITGASIGRAAVFNLERLNTNVNQHVCIIRLKNKKLVNYLSILLNLPEMQSFINSTQKGASREGLNFGHIGSFKIKIPENNKLETFNKKYLEILEIIKLKYKNSKNIEEYFDLILKNSF